MNNKHLIIGAIGLGGIFLLARSGVLSRFLKGKAVAAPPANSLGANSRVDTASQPWYNQATNFLTSQANKQVEAAKSNPTQTLKDAGSIVHSLSDFAGISSWFDSDPSTTESGVDDSASWFSSASSDQIQGWEEVNTMPASDVDQSDTVGSMMSDWDVWSGPDADMGDFNVDYGSSDWGVGDSNSDFEYA